MRLLCGDPWMMAVQTSELSATEETVGTRHDRELVLTTAVSKTRHGQACRDAR